MIGNNTRVYDHRLVTGQHEGHPSRAYLIIHPFVHVFNNILTAVLF